MSDPDYNPHGWTPAKRPVEALIRDCEYAINRTELQKAEKHTDIDDYVSDHASDPKESTDYTIITLTEQHTKLDKQLRQLEDDIAFYKSFYKSEFGVEYRARSVRKSVSVTPKQMTEAVARAKQILSKSVVVTA